MTAAAWPDRLPDLLTREGLLWPGCRVLELGAGDGALARLLAARGARVLALEADPAAVAAARRAAPAGAPEFAEGLAERTFQPDAAFDLVVAARSWPFFDRALAAAEARRVLRPGGALLILQQGWLPRPGGVAHATEWLIEAHAPRWRGGGTSGLHPAFAEDLSLAGFEAIGFAGFDHLVTLPPATWRGWALAASGLAGAAAARLGAELDALLAARFPGPLLAVPHRLFAVWGRRPEADAAA